MKCNTLLMASCRHRHRLATIDGHIKCNHIFLQCHLGYAMLCCAMRCDMMPCAAMRFSKSKQQPSASGCDSQPSESTTVGRQQNCSCHNGKVFEKTANNNNKWQQMACKLIVMPQSRRLSAHPLNCHTPSLLPLYANLLAVVAAFHSFTILWLGVSWTTIISCLPSSQICGLKLRRTRLPIASAVKQKKFFFFFCKFFFFSYVFVVVVVSHSLRCDCMLPSLWHWCSCKKLWLSGRCLWSLSSTRYAVAIFKALVDRAYA